MVKGERDVSLDHQPAATAATAAASAGAVCRLQGEASRLRHQHQLAQLKARELREELSGCRKEARHLKKSMRTLEVRWVGGSAGGTVT